MPKVNSKENKASEALARALETALARYKNNKGFDALDIKTIDDTLQNYILHGLDKEPNHG